jgi:drug/metabolite transporter (DMT)-like permease
MVIQASPKPDRVPAAPHLPPTWLVAGKPADPTAGIALLMGAIVMFSISDTLSKILNRSIPPVEIAWLRYLAFSTLLLVPVLRAGPAALRTARPGLQILRGLGVLGSAVFFIAAVRFMPLAEATAMSFMSPVMITVLSVIFLDERPGVRRWSAIGAGILGMLIVVRPGAMSWAVAIVVTRHMRAGDGVLITLGWTALTGLAVMSLLLPFWFVALTPGLLALGLLAGVVNSAAQWFVVMAYRAADASLLAPLSYLQLVLSTLLGFLVFHAIPDGWTVLGAVIIVGSGLYIAHRERVVTRPAQVT